MASFQSDFGTQYKIMTFLKKIYLTKIFQTLNSVGSNSISLKYKFGKVIGTRNFFKVSK